LRAVDVHSTLVNTEITGTRRMKLKPQTIVVGTRFYLFEEKLIAAVARRRRLSVADFVREVVRAQVRRDLGPHPGAYVAILDPGRRGKRSKRGRRRA
jgi:hypothetical protein